MFLPASFEDPMRSNYSFFLCREATILSSPQDILLCNNLYVRGKITTFGTCPQPTCGEFGWQPSSMVKFRYLLVPFREKIEIYLIIIRISMQSSTKKNLLFLITIQVHSYTRIHHTSMSTTKRLGRRITLLNVMNKYSLI
jgi:hypothetical protein